MIDPVGPTLEDLKRDLAAARAELKKHQDDGGAQLATAKARVAELEKELADLQKAAATPPPEPKKPRSWAPWDPA